MFRRDGARAVLVRCGYFETRDTALLAEFRRKFISIFHFSNQTSRSVAPDDLVQLPIPNLFSDVGFVRFIGILSIGSRLGDGDENRVRAAGDFDKGRAGFFGGVGIRFDADVVIACPHLRDRDLCVPTSGLRRGIRP